MAAQYLIKPSPTESPIPLPSISNHLPHPHHGLESAGKFGHLVLWVVTVAMFLFAVAFAGASFRLPKKNRIFHYICALINLFAAVSYFMMASGANGQLINARGHHAFRELLTARYVDWAFTTPLLLLDLALFAGLSAFDTVILVILDEFMIVTGLLGALHPVLRYRFVLYVVSCAALAFIYGILFVNGRQAAKARSDKVAGAYLALSGLTVVVWLAYPIIFLFAEQLNVINANTEILLYAIADVVAKPGFSILLLVFHTQLADFDSSLPAWFVDASAGHSHSYSAIPASD